MKRSIAIEKAYEVNLDDNSIGIEHFVFNELGSVFAHKISGLQSNSPKLDKRYELWFMNFWRIYQLDYNLATYQILWQQAGKTG